jgi:hypothetical protein
MSEVKKEFIKLEPEFKKTWIAALRSTAYVQAQGKLYAGSTPEGQHKMCCLGVAEHLCGTQIEDFGNEGMPQMLDEPKSPINVLRQDVPDSWPVKYSTVALYLAQMNDRGKTFEEIAQFIEENL